MLIPDQIPGTQNDYTTRPCAQVNYIFGNMANVTVLLYPECQAYFDGTKPNQHALIQAKMGENPVEIAAFIGMAFGAAFAVALPLHAFLVEVYVSAALGIGCASTCGRRTAN